MTISLVGAELFHADRRTDGQEDIAKRTVIFRDFQKWTKIIFIHFEIIIFKC